jgi:hypothetical protein
MDVIGFVATIVVVLGAGVWPIVRDGLAARRRESERTAVWAGAARAAGLTAIEARGAALEARAGDIQLRITPNYELSYEGTRLELWGPRFAPGLSLRLEAGGPRPNPREVEVGAEAFDRKVSIEGSPALALALLDPATREALVALLMGRLEVRGRPRLVVSHLDDGVLRIDIPAPAAAGLSGATVQAAVGIAQRFVAPAHLAERLAAISEPNPRPASAASCSRRCFASSRSRPRPRPPCAPATKTPTRTFACEPPSPSAKPAASCCSPPRPARTSKTPRRHGPWRRSTPRSRTQSCSSCSRARSRLACR